MPLSFPYFLPIPSLVLCIPPIGLGNCFYSTVHLLTEALMDPLMNGIVEGLTLPRRSR